MISTWHERTLREALQQLHQAAPDSLPAVRYWHDGPHWAEWLRGVLASMPAPLGLADAAYVRELLASDIATHLTAGQLPTPELEATLLRWRHGPEGALHAFVQAAWDRGEVPDDNTAWLLLHQDKIPADFPMYRRAR
jgi:hypothetical protein